MSQAVPQAKNPYFFSLQQILDPTLEEGSQTHPNQHFFKVVFEKKVQGLMSKVTQ